MSQEFRSHTQVNQALEAKQEDKALREQTDAFEAFFVKQILDLSLKTQNALFGKDASDEIYTSMYNDTMSKALSGGLGFSKLLYDFLKERG
ncbi:rod-binding protein [Campylobacter sp. MIT 21-1682]|uniref:rod-binding protein n=1 Tax=unclassified Campylobacter TaxID=2593542 RepID=UPI003A5213E8